MFPQVQHSRYRNSSLPDEFFKRSHLIGSSSEYVVPLPVLVSSQCKHTCIFIFVQDKFASVHMGRLVNPRAIFRDIHSAINLLISKRLPFTYDNLVKVSAFVATEDITVPIGTVLFLPEERGILYRFILETYIASMYDFLFLLHTHRSTEAILDIRITEITPNRLVIHFDQGLV